MAASTPTMGAPTRASRFIAKLLAPIPADVPQADDKGFLRLLKTDACTAWRRHLRPFYVAQARLNFVRAQQLVDATVDENEAFAAYVGEIDRMIAIPTIAREGVTWKRKHARIGAFRDTLASREALIALDEARMEGR